MPNPRPEQQPPQKKKRSTYARVWLASFLAGLATQIFPGTVSQPLDDYLREEGVYTPKLKDYFQARSVRVYDPENPLITLHESIEGVKKGATSGDLVLTTVAGASAFSLPFLQFQRLLMDNKTGPGTCSHVSAGDQVFFRPFEAGKSLPTFTYFDEGGRYAFRTDKQTMTRMLNTFTALHEIRHTAQSHAWSAVEKESGADIFARRVMLREIADRDAVNEALEIMRHKRALDALLAGGGGHATSMALEDGDIKIANACSRAFSGLAEIVDSAEEQKVSFAEKTGEEEKRYYIVRTLLDQGALKRDKLVERAAVSYIQACDYFNKACAYPKLNRMPQDMKPAVLARVAQAELSR